MDETEIKVMLDQLSDFQAHRDLLDSDKRALLDDVKIPAEVEAIVKDGMKRMSEAENPYSDALKALEEEVDTKLALVVIPEEIKTALAEIDRQRTAIRTYQGQKEAEIGAIIRSNKSEIQKSVEAQTADIYAAIAARKRDIEAEFAGKAEAVDENIRKLTEAIKDEVKTYGKSVKADHFQAVYVKGRITWNTDMMEGWRETFPFLEKARKEGDPSVSLKRI